MLRLAWMQGLYTYLFCMMGSSILTDMPLLGGALFMCGQVSSAMLGAYRRNGSGMQEAAARHWRRALLAAMFVLNTCVVVLYPMTIDNPRTWLVFALVLATRLRDEYCRRILAGSVRRKWLWLATGQLALLGGTSWLLMYNVGGADAWQMLGCYVLCSGMECYCMVRGGVRAGLHQLPQAETAQARETEKTLRQASAFKAYETLSTLILMALVVTLLVMYTYLAVTAETMLRYMILAVGCMIAGREAAEWFLRWRSRRKEADPSNLLVLGLCLWMWGLIRFGMMLGEGAAPLTPAYIHMGLCTAGVALSLICLDRMEGSMAQVARFAAHGDAPGYSVIRAQQKHTALLLGQMLALAALTALCFAMGKDLLRDAEQLAARFQPLMVLPALLVVLVALLSALRFPLNSRWTGKLKRLMHIKAQGGENPSLERQLESVVVRRHKRPLGTRIIMALLRPFFRHAVKGAEHILEDEDNPLVFLCNHGEIYGPVACMLWIPVPIRPWVISELNVNKDEVTAYIYKYTFSKIRWLGRLQMPVSRLLGPLSVWCMTQLESIPVFRNKPRELMKTFRVSVEALEAGDNLLIFPENPDADRENPGYEQEGTGELFRGFVMLAQVYYNRTGKRCRFLPMYAHKGARTLSFGEIVTYNPDNDPIRERDRIVDCAHQQMVELAQREEQLYRQQIGAQ